MPGEVTLTVSTNKAQYPVTGTNQLAYVLIEAAPSLAVADIQMPLNFCFVLDHSGSMAGEKLKSMKTAAKLAVDQMTASDVVSLIIFDDRVSVIMPSQPATDKAAMHRRIDRISDGGGTTLSLGMKLGLKELRKALGPDRVSQMLLLTDGETFGDEETCCQLASQAGGDGIPITALGLGEDWNVELLKRIAADSHGDSDYIPADQPDVILKSFRRRVRDAQASVVQHAEMILRLVPAVTPRAVWRAKPLIGKLSPRALSDRDVQVSLGDLVRAQGQSVLIELLIPPRQPGNYRVAQAEVMYDVAAKGVEGERVRADVVVGFTTDPALAAQVNPMVMNTVEKVTAHKLQTRALDEAAVGNIVGATQKLRAAATRLLELGEQDLALTALEEAGRLEQGGQMSKAGTRKLDYGTRKLSVEELEDF